MAYIRLPDNSFFKVPEGASPQDAMAMAQEKYPKAFLTEGELEQKQGFMPAAGEAWKEFKKSSLTGLGEMTGSETVQNWAQQAHEEAAKEQAAGKQGFIPTEEEDVKKAWEKGLLPGLGASARKYISEPLGGIAGRYAAPIAAGAGAAGLAALAAPGLATTGAGILGAGLLGKGVTSLTDLPAEVGENIQRQLDTGKPVDATSATTYGLIQAALAGFGIPGLGKLTAPVQKMFGSEANVLAKEVVAGTISKDAALAKLNGTLKNIALGTGEAAVTGAGLMVGTEAARRASAGQGVTDEEAMKEYGQQLVGAAEMAPLFGVMHGVGVRGREKKAIGEASKQYEVTKGREERAKADAEAAALAEEKRAEEFKARQAATMGQPENAAEGVQGRTGDLFGEQNRTEGPVKGKQAFGKMEGDVSPLPGVSDNLLPREREQAEQARVAGQRTPYEVMSEERNLNQHVTTLRDQVAAAAEKADIKTLGELAPRLKQAEEAYAAISKEYGALDIPEVKERQLTDKIEKKIKELKKAGGATGNFEEIGKLTADIQKLQAELEKVKKPAGPDLFDVSKDHYIKEEIGKYEDELGAYGENTQRTAEQERQRKEASAYAMREKDIEAAFDKYTPGRIADELVGASDRAVAAKKPSIAETSDVLSEKDIAAHEQRVARVTAAYKEAVAKAEETREPLMLAQNKADTELTKFKEQAEERIKRATEDGESKKEIANLKRRIARQQKPLEQAVEQATTEAARPHETVKELEKRLAEAKAASARPQVENRRNQALEDQVAAVEDLRSHIEDLKSGRYLGAGAKDTSTAASLRSGIEQKANAAIGRYAEAAIRDVNAAREQGGGKRMTIEEATRLAMDVRGHLENAVRNLNESALRMPKGSTVSAIERQLAQIKKKHVKIEKAPIGRSELFNLRQEFEPKERVKGEEGTPYETPERKAERLANEEKERVASERTAHDAGHAAQIDLFKPKEIQSVFKEGEAGVNANIRATPENFMRLLNSESVQKLRNKMAEIDRKEAEAARAVAAVKPKLTKAEQMKAKQQSTLRGAEAAEQKLENMKQLAGKIRTAIAKTDRLKKQLTGKISKAINPERANLMAERLSVDKLNVTQKQKLANLEEEIKKLEKDKKDDLPLEGFASQVRKQREVVTELANAEELADNLRNNAHQLWRMVNIANTDLKKAEAATKDIASKLEKVASEKKALNKELTDEMSRAEGAPAFAEEMIGKIKAEIKTVDKEITALKKEYYNALAKEEKARGYVDKLREEAPRRMAEVDRYHDRAKELLEGNIKAERALLDRMERRLAKMDELSPEAKALTEEAAALRKQTAISERESTLAKEKRDKEMRLLEQEQFESDKLFRTTREEIVGTNYKTQNVRELKKKERLEERIGEERDRPVPDDTKIIRLERELAAIETRQEVTRKKITREVPLATEALKREERVEENRRAVEELKEKAEARKETGGVSRIKLADVLEEESRVSANLKEVQRKLSGFANLIKGLDKAVKDSTKAELKAGFEKRLKVARRANAKLVAEEGVLKDKLTELRKVGVGVERTLEAVGNKPGREQRTAVKGEELTPQQKEARKAAAAHARLLRSDFEAYLQSEKRGRDEDYSGYYSGTKYRADTAHTGERLDPKVSKAVSDAVEKNAPKDVVLKSVESFEELPEKVKAQLVRDGFVEGGENTRTIRGFVTPEGEVYIIRGNHKSIKDMETTYVHELVGHAGVDRILGEKGMDAITKRVEAHGGALELAKKLGIEDQVKGALDDYALGIQEMTNRGAPKEKIDKALKDMETQAVRELIAYTAEKRVDENFKQKAGRWLQEIVGAVRQWLRDSGMAELSKVSTSDIYNILRQSQRNYNKGELGAFRESNGQVAFSNKKPVYAEGFDPGLQEASNKIYLPQKSAYDRIKAGTSGMSMMTRFVDRFAPLEYIARNMVDKLEGVQMMYYNRLYDQRNNMMAEIATHGAVKLDKNADGSYQYKTRKGPGLKDVFETAAKSKDRIGDGSATTQQFGLYLAAERAASDKGGLEAGLTKLSLDGKLSVAEAKRILDFGRNDKNFQEARKQYREYNDGMLDLMVETGRLSKEDAAKMKGGDYVPYYREKNGEVWDTEHNIKVGDLKTQAYLKELIGGDSAIVNFETGALQNTYMLTDMAMGNIATKNTAYTLQSLGIARIKKGDGAASPNVIRFYEDGKKMHAILETSGGYVRMEEKLDKMRDKGKANTPEYKKLRERAEASRASESIFGEIPAELIVKGMEGVATSTPLAVSMMRGPANLLRKAVTRNPAYAARVAFKDSLSGWITSGADVKPVVGALGNLKKSWEGQSPEVRALQEQGIIGGHVFAGTMSDMRTVAQQIAQGKTGWEKLWAKADRMAIIADEAARLTLYNGFVKKGMSPMEATLATLESQNFTKHGFSPSMKMLSTMIPFFNAQVQGLNTFARGISGKSLFEDAAGVKAKFLARGAVLSGMTMIYAALMQNNEAYKNATEEERAGYWFIPVPGLKEPIRVPIPFEAGIVFKALPEAMFNLATTDAKSKDVLPALGKQVLNSIPGMSNMGLPQGIKPVIEMATNTNFFTGNPIESQRQRSELPGYRYGANTTELSKTIGKSLGISPVMLDHFISSTTSSTGIALMSMFNPMLREIGAPEAKTSQMPIIGGFFQPTDGSGLINKAYNDMQEIEKINTTFKRLNESSPEEADRFLDKNMQHLDNASLAGTFKQQMGDLNKKERQIRADDKLSSAQKRRELDEIKQDKIELAKEFMSISRE